MTTYPHRVFVALFMVLWTLVAIVHASRHSAGTAAESATAPGLLSETGLYIEGRVGEIDPRNRPFSPQYPLWSDGLRKRRWIQLPEGTAIDARNVKVGAGEVYAAATSGLPHAGEHLAEQANFLSVAGPVAIALRLQCPVVVSTGLGGQPRQRRRGRGEHRRRVLRRIGLAGRDIPRELDVGPLADRRAEQPR